MVKLSDEEIKELAGMLNRVSPQNPTQTALKNFIQARAGFTVQMTEEVQNRITESFRQ